MSVVLKFRKPGTRTFPADVTKELYRLSSDIRELQIRQRKYMAKGIATPKSLIVQLVKRQKKMDTLLEDHCTNESATDAKLALTVYGCLNHPEVESLKSKSEVFESIVRMRTDLNQILERLFLWSYLPPPDSERVKMINAYIRKVQARVNERIIAEAV